MYHVAPFTKNSKKCAFGKESGRYFEKAVDWVDWWLAGFNRLMLNTLAGQLSIFSGCAHYSMGTCRSTTR